MFVYSSLLRGVSGSLKVEGGGEGDMTEAGRAERDRVDREQWLGRFPGGIPPYPTTTPEEEAHWAKCESVRQKLGHTKGYLGVRITCYVRFKNYFGWQIDDHN